MPEGRPENPASAEALLEQAGWVRALARRLVARGDDPDDAAQATWLAALEKPPALRSSPRSWLRAVLSHTVFRTARRAGLRDAAEAAHAARGSVESAADVVQRGEIHQRLVAHVMALAEPGRSTILLHYFDGLPLAEIARRLEVPQGTVRARHHRAVEELRRRLCAERSDWRAVVAPLACAGAGVSGAGQAAAEVLVMTAKAKTALVGAALLLLGGVALFFTVPSIRESLGVGGAGDRSAAEASGEALAVGAPSDVRGPGPETRLSGPRPFTEDERAVLAGRVRREDGTPVDGARVVAVRYDLDATVDSEAADNPRGFPRVASTDANGEFRIEAAGAAPAFAVTARAAGFAPKTVTVWPGRQSGPIDLVLEAGVVLEGTVRELDRSPIAGARVAFNWFSGGVALRREVRSGSDGTYRIEGLPRALDFMQYGLVVAMPGRATQRLTYLREPDSSLRIHQDVYMARGASVEGIVVDVETGAPIPDARVYLWATNMVGHVARPDGSTLRNPDEVSVLGQAAAGPDGRFIFEHVPSWAVHSVAGFRPFGVQARSLGGVAAFVAGRAPAVAPLDLPDEDGTVSLVVRVKAGARIHGRVVDQDGRPVAGATVSRSPDADENTYGWLPRRTFADAASVDAVTDADGRYRLDGVPVVTAGAASFQLSVRAGSWPERQPCTTTVSVAGASDVEAPDLVLVPDFERSAVIRVQAEDGTPVWGAAVAFQRHGNPPYGRTDRDGWAWIRFPSAPEEGVHPIAVEAPGFARREIDLVASSKAPVELTVTLVPGHAVSGTVSYADGKPAAGATVFVGDGSRPLDAVFPDVQWWDYPSARVGDDGTFEIRELVPGPYHLAAHVWIEDKRSATRLASVSDGAKGIRIVLQRPEIEPRGGLLVTCTEAATGRPILKCAARLRQLDAQLAALTTAPGELLFESVKAGAWTLEVDATGFIAVDRDVEVVAGRVSRVAIALRKGVRLKGRVRHPEGRAFQDPNLGLTGSRHNPPILADGSFEVDGIAPGAKIGVNVSERVGESWVTWVTRRQDAFVVPQNLSEVTAEFLVVAAATLEVRVVGERLFTGRYPVSGSQQDLASRTSIEVRDAEGNVVRRDEGIHGVTEFWLPFGRYVVKLEVPGAAPQEKAVTLSEARAEVSFEVP